MKHLRRTKLTCVYSASVALDVPYGAQRTGIIAPNNPTVTELDVNSSKRYVLNDKNTMNESWSGECVKNWEPKI